MYIPALSPSRVLGSVGPGLRANHAQLVGRVVYLILAASSIRVPDDPAGAGSPVIKAALTIVTFYSCAEGGHTVLSAAEPYN
jgi:hypothetical protein